MSELEVTVIKLRKLLVELEQGVTELTSQIQVSKELEKKYHQAQSEKKIVSAEVVKLQDELANEQQSYSYTGVNEHPLKIELQQMREDMRTLREQNYQLHSESLQQKQEISALWKSVERLDKRFGSHTHDSLVSENLASLEKSVLFMHDSDHMSLMAYETYPIFKKPLCLIYYDIDGKLMVADDVLNQMSQIPKQLNVVAITGLYRTGKSYLLNRLALVNKGFPLGSTIESKTKGIWAWCRPHPVKRDEVLLLLDTEGLGDISKGNNNHDNWILTLATLLSSTLVYNALGKLDQDTLEMLSFIAEMLKHVKISDSPSSKKGDEDLALYFPLFILCLRDFSIELRFNDREITSDEYLEDCLSLKGPEDTDVKYNTPRVCIRKYFKNRKCFTFDRPGSKGILRKLETLTDNDLDEDFVEDSKKFTEYVFNECLPKRLDNGTPVNGRMFATLTRAYVETIRNGKIPCIESALDTMAQIENKKAVEASIELYVEKMKGMLQLPVSNDNVLSDAHHSCTKDAIALFLTRSVYDQKHEYQREANEKIDAQYNNFKRLNEEESENKSKEALAQLNGTIEDKIKQKLYTRAGGYSVYQQDIMNIKEKYEKLTGLGCKKQETILRYMESKWIEGQTILQADHEVSEREKEAEIQKQKAIAAEREKEQIERMAAIQKQQFIDETRVMKENMNQLEKKQKEDLKNLTDHHNAFIESRLKEQERLLKEGFNTEADKLKKEIENLRQDNKIVVQLKEDIEKLRQHNQKLESLQEHKNPLEEDHLRERAYDRLRDIFSYDQFLQERMNHLFETKEAKEAKNKGGGCVLS